MPAFAGLGGEFGHFPLPAGPMIAHGLPVLPCGCGRAGCSETLLSAPGLARIAAHVTGRNLTPEAIVEGRRADASLQKAWDIWLELASEFLITLCFTIDPAVIVIGGGLSNARGLVEDVSRHTASGDTERLFHSPDQAGARRRCQRCARRGFCCMEQE
ncbi:MAG: ROK family protein [Cypionkella sp.]|nr:ROK family protein [Cypionkella sp.]